MMQISVGLQSVALSYGERLESALRQLGIVELKPRQKEAIDARAAGKDVLGILPTSYGKTACFWIPGMVMRHRKLVISPLIALQEDQVRKLRKTGVKAFAYHSGLDVFRQAAVHHYYKTAPKDEPSFLYISPELLLKETFHERFGQIGFDHAAVDEAHCVSTWGDAFRPEYQRIKLAVKMLKIPTCSAFTATADAKIEEDIRNRIPLRPDFVRIVEDPIRPNLILNVEKFIRVGDASMRKSAKKIFRLQQLLKDPTFDGPTIVYYNSIKGSAGLYLKLRKMQGFLSATGYTPHLFHAQLPMEDKTAALKGFLTEPKPLVIATSAFGMGIDRADIRQVVHYKTPFGLVDYAQQFGRGGRDGLPTLCTTFHASDDETDEEIDTQISFEIPRYDTVERIYTRLMERVKRLTPEERRKYNLAAYMRSQLYLIEHNAEIQFKSSAARRFSTALAFLQRAKLVFEGENGIEIRPLIPGTERHVELLTLTKMHERRLSRERKRVAKFFGSEKPTQQLLWSMMSED